MTPIQRLQYALIKSDISVTVLIAGTGLLMWGLLGVFKYPDDLDIYAKMYTLVSVNYWALNHLVVGVLMYIIVALRFPYILSLFTSAWLIVAWSWSAFMREATDLTAQNGRASAIMYIIIGLFILHRITMEPEN